MDANWTPGPWHVEKEAEPEGDEPEVYVCHPGTVCTATVVCTMGWSVRFAGEQRGANAQLIAAAPELFEALELMQFYASKTPQFVKNDAAWAAFSQATRALSKARGEDHA